MQVHDSLIDLIGNTPLVRLRKVTRGLGGAGPAPDVLAKVEYFNPGGSVKDRIALRMVVAAEASGALQPGGAIIEPTSGNTGIGLAIVAAEKGYKCLFVCPDKVGQDNSGHRQVPEGDIRRASAGDRRRSRGVGVFRRIRPALPGRGRRRGHLACYL